MPAVPASVVPPAHTDTLDVGGDHQRGGIKALPAGAPQPQQQFVILGCDLPAHGLYVRGIEADPIEDVFSVGAVGSDEAQAPVIPDAEGRVAVVHQREGRPVLGSEPPGPGSRPSRDHLAAHARDVRVLAEKRGDGPHPLARRPHIVVGERDHRRPGGTNARIAGMGQPLLALEHIAEVREARAERFADLAGPIVGVVVDDDDLEVVGLEVLLRQALERAGQDVSTVVRAQNHRHLRGAGRLRHQSWARGPSPPSRRVVAHSRRGRTAPSTLPSHPPRAVSGSRESTT